MRNYIDMIGLFCHPDRYGIAFIGLNHLKIDWEHQDIEDNGVECRNIEDFEVGNSSDEILKYLIKESEIIFRELIDNDIYLLQNIWLIGLAADASIASRNLASTESL